MIYEDLACMIEGDFVLKVSELCGRFKLKDHLFSEFKANLIIA